MTANSRLATCIHILCFIAYVDDEVTRSESIAKSLKTNPVVVRKLLKLLEAEDLVEIRHGRYGGVNLKKTPEEITLADIYRAVERDDGIFAKRERVHPKCPVACAMKKDLGSIFADATEAVESSLKKTTLANLVGLIGSS